MFQKPAMFVRLQPKRIHKTFLRSAGFALTFLIKHAEDLVHKGYALPITLYWLWWRIYIRSVVDIS
jgi:hypothetical protein